jgi:putative toxin-antitoxin system antitoxin component (TIGR02293 family)
MAQPHHAPAAPPSRPRQDPAYAFLAILGVPAGGLPDVTRQLERGLPYRALEEFQRRTALTVAEVSSLISVPVRTLIRRRGGGRLQPAQESDRLVRAARIFADAVRLFEGDDEAARAWLATPQLSLGGATPYEASRTDPGAREVERLIGRLAHGIPG